MRLVFKFLLFVFFNGFSSGLLSGSDVKALSVIDVGAQVLYLGTEGDLYLESANGREYIKCYSSDRYGRMRAIARGGDTLIAVGENGKILRSTSEGNRWVLSDTPFLLGDLNAVSPGTESTWLAVGNDGANAVAIVSIDDGLSWEFLPNSQARSLIVPRVATEKQAYYFDSLYGDDSKDGLTQSTAKRTLFAVNAIGSNAIVYLARGSEWREQLTVNDHVEVRAYGRGPPPIINAADPVENNRFEAVESFSSVYSVSWVLASTNKSNLMDVVQVLEDGKPLKWANSVSLCNQVAGSFYETRGSSDFERIIYIHPSNGLDLRVGESLYEIAKRPHALVVGNYCTISGVSTKNNAHNDGSLTAGTFLYGARLDLRHGTKHIALLGGDCFVKDSEIYHSNNRNITNNSGQIVVYNRVLEDHEIIFQQCHFSQDASISRNAYAFISHGDQGIVSYNKTVVFDACRFSNFKLAHAALGLGESNNPLSAAWFVESRFENCNKVWNSSGYSKMDAYYISCSFINDSTIGRSYLFEGARDGRLPRGGLHLYESWFQVLNTTILIGTFDSLHLEWNTFNGVDSTSGAFLSAFDFVDGDGASGESLRFRNNHILGYTKPIRYKDKSTFTGFEKLEWDFNIYLNYNNAGQFEENFRNKTFSDWQASVGIDLSSHSRKMEDGDLSWEDSPEKVRFIESPFLAGPEVRSMVDSPLAIERDSILSAYLSVDWHPLSGQWVAVGESGFGVAGGGRFINKTHLGNDMEFTSSTPLIQKVSVGSQGSIVLAGKERTLMSTHDLNEPLNVLEYTPASKDDFIDILRVGSGYAIAFARNGSFIYNIDQENRINGQILIISGELASVGMVNGALKLLTENGRQIEDYIKLEPIYLSLEVVDMSQLKVIVQGVRRGNLYWLEQSLDLQEDPAWQKVHGSEIRTSGSLYDWTIDNWGTDLQKFWRVVAQE